jgi:1-acyl-sn-glycerol-3-phosphate acyltransferase
MGIVVALRCRLRAGWRLARMCLHLGYGVLLATLWLPRLAPSARQPYIQTWAAKCLRVLGITLQASGQPRPGAKLLVANHVSWLDIIAIHAVCPEARFVSKAEVRHWPVLGSLIDAAGTLFIERERKRDAMRVVHQMAEALKAGDTVAVFPEGTTSDGHGLLPFHANLLQAAISTGTPVQPIALRFADAGAAVSAAAAYIGDTTLIESLLAVLMADGLQAQVSVLSAGGSHHADRRALAEHVREQIATSLAG